MQTLFRCEYAVFCSPSRRNMADKGHQDEITYPELYFTLDNFDDIFGSILEIGRAHV